jgi:hypothetical protein
MQASQSLDLDEQYRDFTMRDQVGAGVSPDQRMRTAKINDRPGRKRPWLLTRVFRGLVRFCVAVLIGIGATLGWQNYGDQARDLITAWNPSLSPLLPPSPTPTTGDTTAATGDLGQQIKLIALDVAIVRRDLEQIANNQGALAAKADQMTQNIAALQQAGQDVRQRMASPATAPAAPVRVAPRKPPQPVPQSLQTSSAPPPPATLADPPAR